MAFQIFVLSQPVFKFDSRVLCTQHENWPKRMFLSKNSGIQMPLIPKCVKPCNFANLVSDHRGDPKLFTNGGLKCLVGSSSTDSFSGNNDASIGNLNFILKLLKKRMGTILAATVFGVLLFGCPQALAVEGVVAIVEHSKVFVRNAWPKVLPVLRIFKEQGLVLAVLLALSAFFSMAETSITTLWPWKVRELAEKESENFVFKLLQKDVTRFLTTILIGTTVVNIGATALVTNTATAAFGEAGVTAATGLMTVAILLLTEITPKSFAVHNATDVARFVVRPVGYLSVVLYPVGRVVTYFSKAILKLLGIKGTREPYVTEEELKLMVRGAELSGAIEEEEQDMIENVLEIKVTRVREVMTPLVDVVAIDASASLVDFRNLWREHQYSRIPIFEKRVDNLIGIAYSLDLLDFCQKGGVLDITPVQELAHDPVYFVPDSMSIWDLLRDFRFKQVHMAVVCNEYGGTVGIVTLEDIVEEIVGEIFDENDSKEEIQKKTGHIVKQADGVFDVDAKTSIDHLSEYLNIKMPQGHQYETVSGFACENFGYIPMAGESIEVVLERKNQNDNDVSNANHKNQKETFKLKILSGNAKKVTAVQFTRTNGSQKLLETKVTPQGPTISENKM
ncbi:DUF21 domain-containing protein At1g55930, chloroplastic isoform X2 [Cajanus cajan]|uniref:DUF21 domain-containing protein At1g55930, chloroplastic isoform X2 n=1 Tax=Cajanus cajan TaxID=3821 RepID=UPI0010FB110C|nr:DUF21 domain-containing protein At1g55930, chloroplastic isoform X2 [Cajanus cajan]